MQPVWDQSMSVMHWPCYYNSYFKSDIDIKVLKELKCKINQLIKYQFANTIYSEISYNKLPLF